MHKKDLYYQVFTLLYQKPEYNKNYVMPVIAKEESEMQPLIATVSRQEEAELAMPAALLESSYPELAAITDPAWLEILQRARVMQIPAKFTLLMENGYLR